MKRLFIAIRIIPDQNMLDQYNSLKESLNAHNIRWVEPDKFHITLKFLGDTSDEVISDVNKVIIDTFVSKRSFNIELIKTGIFGSRYDPRVIWFGIDNCQPLTDIATELIDNLHNAGFNKDRQNFVPHLTVGRINKISDKKSFNAVIEKFRNSYLQKYEINEVLLMESVLSRKGPTYYVISSHKLS